MPSAKPIIAKGITKTVWLNFTNEKYLLTEFAFISFCLSIILPIGISFVKTIVLEVYAKVVIAAKSNAVVRRVIF